MAKIVELNTIITVSKLVKNDEDVSTFKLDDEFKDTIVDLVSQLLGSEYVVEITVAD